MSGNPRVAFFDAIAAKWDEWEDLPTLDARLAAGLVEIGLGPDETVLDVGCGTGNLTRAVLAKLSPTGRVIAVDIAPRMIEAARRKVTDPRVEWHVADASRPALADASVDRAICYSVWPHFDDPAAAASELRRVLRIGGRFHVWHSIPRVRVNEIHASAGEPVRRDVLPPAAETARLLVAQGFRVVAAIDDADRYLVSAVKAAP
ncbi:MAG: class I SAM-dependent methyltransferase [Myxococcota bacterium]|nr:class I SAM-dependent methyltransferase [Myxococcota bacterium]